MRHSWPTREGETAGGDGYGRMAQILCQTSAATARAPRGTRILRRPDDSLEVVNVAGDSAAGRSRIQSAPNI
jgi:hypothetical protein